MIVQNNKFRGKGTICREIETHLENLAYLTRLEAPERIKVYDRQQIALLECELEQLSRGVKVTVSA